MATLAEIRAKYPQYQDIPDNELADKLHQRFYADMPRADFDARLGLTSAAPAPARQPTVADQVADAAWQAPQGFNRGVDSFINAPYNLVRGAAGLAGLELPEAKPIFERFNPGESISKTVSGLYGPESEKRPAETDAGRYAGSVGEVVGSSVLPSAGLVGNAQRLAALAPTTAPRAIGQTVGASYAAAPGRAVAADAIAATGAGIGQQAAKDMDFGETGQMVGGILGGVTPFALAAPFTAGSRAVQKARATSDPHAKVAASLGEGQSVDDVAHSTAVGYTGIDPANNYAQRVLDTLGQEMVAANGHRPTALAATLRRLETEGNVSAATARDQLRRVVNAQGDNELMLGEYPAVMGSNEATRGRNADVLMRELDTANNMPNAAAANRHRIDNDPGRIEDAGTHWMMDTVANAGSGPSSQLVRNAVENRVAALQRQMQDRIQSWAPHGADTNDVEQALNRMRQAGRAAYRAVYDAPGGTAVDYNRLHSLLPRVVERYERRAAGLGAEHSKALRDALDQLYVERPAGVVAREELPALEDQLARARQIVREARRQRAPKEMTDQAARYAEGLAEDLRLTRRDATPATQRYLLPTLEQLQNARGALRGKRQEFTQAGRTDIADVVLGPLYRDITRVMERSSPAWRVANRQWADLQLDVVARELGENIGLQAGPRFREQMREFNQLALQAQDFVRVEVAQKFIDKIANMGDGENLAKLFKTPHIRHLVRTMFGEEAAVDMRRIARDNKAAAKTKGMMGGSPTQPRLARQQEMNADIQLLEATKLPTSVGGFLEALKKYTIGRLIERRNRQIAGILTTPMRDTAAVAENLERMRAARALAERYARPPIRQTGIAGQAGSILAPYDND